MGNKRSGVIPFERSGQCDSVTGVCDPTKLHADVYPKVLDRGSADKLGGSKEPVDKRLSDRATLSQQMTARELDNVLSRLQRAQDSFNKQGLRAALPGYQDAIRCADSIDQKAVLKERAIVKELLKSDKIDLDTRQKLQREDADLRILQRSPGIVRSDLALRLIESGNFLNGMQLLLEAQKRDPEMNRSADFQRRLKHAIDAGQDAKNPVPVPRLAPPQVVPIEPRQQPPQFPIQPPQFPIQPQPFPIQPRQPQLMPVEPRLQPWQQPPQFPIQPQQFPVQPKFPVQPRQPQLMPVEPRQQLWQQPPQVKLPDQSAPLDLLRRQSNQPDVTPLQLPVGRFAPLDSQGRSPVESSQSAFASVTGAKTLTPEVRRQFELAIKNADTGVSPKLAFFQQQETKAANLLKPLMAPEIAKVMVGFDEEVSKASAQMPPDKKRVAVQLYGSIDKAPNAVERQEAQNQLIKLNPALKDILTRREQYLGPNNVQLLLNYNGWKNAVQTEKNQVAITRFVFSLALSKNGDHNEAKVVMAQALKLNRDPELTEHWKSMAKKIGL